MMKQWMQMMSGMGMLEEMVGRIGAMMKTPVFPDSPCAANGQAERLGLSNEQSICLERTEE